MALFQGIFREGKYFVRQNGVPFDELFFSDYAAWPVASFSWPGPDLGSAGLALALLVSALPLSEALALHYRFETEVVATWTEPEWACTTEGIRAWAGRLLPLATHPHGEQLTRDMMARFQAIRALLEAREEVPLG